MSNKPTLNENETDQKLANFQCQAQVRYHQEMQDCTVNLLPNGDAEVVFKSPVKAVAAGQSIVFYEGEVLLGGGIIDQILE